MTLFGARYRAFCRILCCILALHLLNYSIDPQDPEFVPEDISFNEIESIAELVAEVFGLEAFFEDFDENDTDGADHAAYTGRLVPGKHDVLEASVVPRLHIGPERIHALAQRLLELVVRDAASVSVGSFSYVGASTD